HHTSTTSCISCSPASYFLFFFFLNAPAPPYIYTLSLHDALPILSTASCLPNTSLSMTGTINRINSTRNSWYAATRETSASISCADRKSTRLNSSHVKISYAVFCLKKKTKNHENKNQIQQQNK